MSNQEEKENLFLSKLKELDFFKTKENIENHLQNTNSNSVATTRELRTKTSNETIDQFLNRNPQVTEIERQGPGKWLFRYDQVNAYIMTDDRDGVDRMRIMSLISDKPTVIAMVDPERLLRANCHEALDARYCTENDGSLWTAFIHPLSTLAMEDLESGLRQVTYLSSSYPDHFSSLGLVFQGA